MSKLVISISTSPRIKVMATLIINKKIGASDLKKSFKTLVKKSYSMFVPRTSLKPLSKDFPEQFCAMDRLVLVKLSL